MKKEARGILVVLVVMMLIPVVMAADNGTSIGIDIDVEDFGPLIWLCDSRVVMDDDLELGRVSGRPVCSLKDDMVEFDPEICDSECCLEWFYTCDESLSYPDERVCWTDDTCVGTDYCCADHPELEGCIAECLEDIGCFLKGPELIERHNNYAFEGEKVEWLVLVMDKNKIEEIKDVIVTINGSKEVECVDLGSLDGTILEECDARIVEEELTEFDDQTMSYYECTFTVERPTSMPPGEYWVTIEVIDDGTSSTQIPENEYWFFNPVIALTIDGNGGSLTFGNVTPGTVTYSNTLLVGNGATSDSGVILDMFISGTDFYDP